MSTRLTGASRFLIFGHRGSPEHFAENTPASFEEALRAGADGFETDLRLLSDGQSVLFHDDEWNERETESLVASDFTQGGVTVAPLASLAAFSGRAKMILEVKRGHWEDELVSSIASWRDLVVASFDHTLIASLALREVSFPLGLTLAGRMVDVAGYATRLGATWLFPNLWYVDAEMTASLHAAGVKVIPWTVNSERDWEKVCDAGCDGIITDRPAEAVAWRAKRARRGQ